MAQGSESTEAREEGRELSPLSGGGGGGALGAPSKSHSSALGMLCRSKGLLYEGRLNHKKSRTGRDYYSPI